MSKEWGQDWRHLSTLRLRSAMTVGKCNLLYLETDRMYKGMRFNKISALSPATGNA